METGPARSAGISLESNGGARLAGLKFVHVKSSGRASTKTSFNTKILVGMDIFLNNVLFRKLILLIK